MSGANNTNLDYKRPIEVADNIFWVGFGGSSSGIHCNPYLVVDGNDAVLIDGGSRTDFATVMLKIMQTGVEPNHISKLIYQHYDPDLCGSIPNLEGLIDNRGMSILSQKQNNKFIYYYTVKSRLECIDDIGGSLKLKSGRKLRFIPIPYARSAGSFMTYDEKTSVLFTSDLFGAFIHRWWELFYKFPEPCSECETDLGVQNGVCPGINAHCMLPNIFNFHKEIMPSVSILRYALDQIRAVDPEIVAPHHGSVIIGREDINLVIDKLYSLTDIGIDGIVNKK